MTLHASRHTRVVLVAATFMLAGTTLVAQPQGRVRFDDMDLNRDGVISRDEWRGSNRDFRAYDLNHDAVLSRNELSNARRRAEEQSTVGNPVPAEPGTSRAFEAGRQRGQEEGRQAGQDDHYRRHWDLDGQQELESADSGYRSDVGPLEEFQAGYREAFMAAYRTAFGANAPRHGAGYRAGQSRGLTDGREAGREDASRRHWDLEGQQELLLADAGYQGDLGSRSDYQEGYRAGFRQGYSDGYGRR
jgi:hypothetical protein